MSKENLYLHDMTDIICGISNKILEAKRANPKRDISQQIDTLEKLHKFELYWIRICTDKMTLENQLKLIILENKKMQVVIKQQQIDIENLNKLIQDSIINK